MDSAPEERQAASVLNHSYLESILTINYREALLLQNSVRAVGSTEFGAQIHYESLRRSASSLLTIRFFPFAFIRKR